MGLDAECLARWSTSRAVALTNPDGPDSNAVNSARLLAAVSDVQGEFRLYAGVPYTATLPEHVALGVAGVEIYLKRFQGKAGDGDLRDWRDALKDAQAQYSWIPPTSTSNLQPSADVATLGAGGLPEFDDARLRNFRPRAAGGGSGGGGAPFGNG